jgi:hypothetical protein
MFSFKAPIMPLMYAQRVVNKYLTRCGKEEAEEEKKRRDIQINEQQTKIEHQHHTNTQIYIFVILFCYIQNDQGCLYYEHSLGSFLFFSKLRFVDDRFEVNIYLPIHHRRAKEK